MRKHTFISLFLIILLSFSQVTFSQTKDDSSKSSLNKGSWSLQFQISRNFTLDTFQGSNISAKRHFSPKHALRFGIGLTASTQDFNRESQEDNNYHSERKDEVEDNYTQIDINCYYIYYANPGKQINVYFGVGPLGGYSDFDRSQMGNQIIQDTLYYDIQDSRKVNGYSIGIHGLIGVEWFVKKEISIHAEYGSAFSYVKEDSEITAIRISSQNDEDKKTSKTESSNFEFHSSGVMFGISVYF
jgi:hypothetical protein